MEDGVLDITLISATIHPEANFGFELTDTYATIRCGKEQRCTRTARDEGKIPIWNESFAFNIHEQDMSKDILVQVFGVGSDMDELVGVSRIPIRTVVGKTEGMLCTLSSPSKGETGKLKTAWRWRPASEVAGTTHGCSHDLLNLTAPSLDTTPKAKETSTFDSVTDSMGKLAMKESYEESPSAPPYSEIDHAGYASQVYGTTSTESYALSNETRAIPGPKVSVPSEQKENTPCSFTSSRNSSETTSFSPASNVNTLVDMYPPYPSSASSSDPAGFSPEGQAIAPTYTTRGIGDILEKGKGHDAYEAPYAYPPPPTHGGGYPPSYPPAEGSGYPPVYAPVYEPVEYPPPYSPSPSLDGQSGTLTKGHSGHGYPPYQSGGYPPSYGHFPSGYPGSAYAFPGGYPPVPQGYPPVPHGYPPPPPQAYSPGSSYPSGYPPYGYPGHGGYQSSAPYPVGHGYGSGYAAGAYVGHSSGKKHYKHHKLPKHSKHHGGYHGFVEPHYMVHGGHHHKHNKHKFYGKRKYGKGSKMFKKFKYKKFKW